MFKEYLGGSADVFSAIGALTTGIIAFNLAIRTFRFFSTHVFGRVLGHHADFRKAGAWAVVTGCTDGIGKAYAEQLAARGLNVVLISRTLSKLSDLARAIESEHKVETRVIAADFSREDIYDEIKTKLANLDIGVLVNNVGSSYDHPEYFADVDAPDFVSSMIHMNCLSVARMSQIVLPLMVQKRCGYVINIGSSAGSRPTPLLSLYSATKAFVDMFSRCLDYEYSKRGITVQNVKPYFVVSKLSKFRNASLFVPSPTTFVKNALVTVGVQSNTTGFWAHEIQDFYVKFIPVPLATHFLHAARSRALKKKNAANKNQ